MLALSLSHGLVWVLTHSVREVVTIGVSSAVRSCYGVRMVAPISSIFAELDELRSELTNQDLAEIVGCRRETVSRLKPPHRPSREIERRIDDVFAVVSVARRRQRIPPGSTRHLLLGRRAELGERSIAELIREKRTAEVLELLVSTPTQPDLDDELDEVLADFRDLPPAASGGGSDDGGDETAPEVPTDLQDVIDRVASVAHDYLGDFRVSADSVWDDTDPPDGRGVLLVELHTPLAFDEANRRFRSFLADNLDLVQPVADRVTFAATSVP